MKKGKAAYGIGRPWAANYRMMDVQKTFGDLSKDALRKEKNGSYIELSEQRCGAKIGDGVSHIERALIVLILDDQRLVWEVEEHKILQCPDKLIITAKNKRKLAFCLGDPEKEDSYVFFHSDDNRQKFSLSVIVENEECVIGLYCSHEASEVYWAQEDKGVSGESDFFSLMKNMIEQEETWYGRVRDEYQEPQSYTVNDQNCMWEY